MFTPKKLDVHSEAFLQSLMRKQLRLSIACAAAFLIGLLGLPLANFLWPEFMSQRVFGFTLSWLILGLGFFPAVWIIAFVFIRRSLQLEAQEAREAQGLAPEAEATSETGTMRPAQAPQ